MIFQKLKNASEPTASRNSVSITSGSVELSNAAADTSDGYRLSTTTDAAGKVSIYSYTSRNNYLSSLDCGNGDRVQYHYDLIFSPWSMTNMSLSRRFNMKSSKALLRFSISRLKGIILIMFLMLVCWYIINAEAKHRQQNVEDKCIKNGITELVLKRNR